jgi:hypothetical protein
MANVLGSKPTRQSNLAVFVRQYAPLAYAVWRKSGDDQEMSSKHRPEKYFQTLPPAVSEFYPGLGESIV